MAENRNQKPDETFPRDEGEHLPPHGTKPAGRGGEEAQAEPQHSPVLDGQEARQADIILDTRKKRRGFLTLLIGAMLLFVALALIAYI